jgi:Flp pilus assembly protein TadB
MKKMILIPALALVFASCKDRTLSDNNSLESAAQAAALQQHSAKQSPKVVYRDRVVYQNTSTHNAQVSQKKGMSSRAKYAIIGGVGVAVIGGVATKSTKGAVIGGVVGAGTGYIIGRKKDKRSGRLQ